MIGAFLAGAVLDAHWFDQRRMDLLRDHVLLVLMPVFFLSTGLRTQWGVGGAMVFVAAALLLVASVAGKLIGVAWPAGCWVGRADESLAIGLAAADQGADHDHLCQRAAGQADHQRRHLHRAAADGGGQHHDHGAGRHAAARPHGRAREPTCRPQHHAAHHRSPGRRSGRRPHHLRRADARRIGARGRSNRRRRAGLHASGCRPGAGTGSGLRCAARCGRRAAAAACRHSDLDQGPVRRGRAGHACGVTGVVGRGARGAGLPGGVAPARGRRRHRRADQHDRVRLLGARPEPALRHTAQPLGSGGRPHSRRILVGSRHLRDRRHGRCRHWQRHRRVGAHPVGTVRPHRLQADRTPRADRGRAAAGLQPRLDRSAGAERCMLRAARCSDGG
jgi:hypothetical protein